jgi:hypothetical protein
VGGLAIVQSDLPLPRKAQLITVYVLARSSTTYSHCESISAKPPMSMTGGPFPMVSYQRWMPFSLAVAIEVSFVSG